MNAWIQFSSGQGPRECERVLWHLFKIFCHEAKLENIHCELIKALPGVEKNSFRSLMISLEGHDLSKIRTDWEGSLLWRAPSPFRPQHKRRNWFVQASFFAAPAKEDFDLSTIKFEAQRGSGPGGQHVNKSATAIRAYYPPLELSVFCHEERSQYRNKMLATARILEAINLRSSQKEGEGNKLQRLRHYQLERGQAHRIFTSKL